MSLPIFPVALYGGVTRLRNWGENVVRYDSGLRQADTAFQKPLFQWTFDVPYMNEFRQSSLYTFVDQQKGQVTPFLMKDGYEYAVNSVLAVRSGITTGTLFFYDTRSYTVRPDSTTIGSLFSSLSGYVTYGQYSYDQDSGILTVNTKASADVWGVRSMQYYRKCAFMQQYSDKSPSWNIFNTNIQIEEIP